MEEKPANRSVETRDAFVRKPQASLEFLSDLLLLPRPLLEPGASTTTDKTIDQGGLPASIAELCARLELICDQLSKDADRSFVDASKDGAGRFSLLGNEPERTIARVRAYGHLLNLDIAVEVDRQCARERALIRHGFVPVEWLMEHFPTLSEACVSNAVSVAQVLVLLVARLGFGLLSPVPRTLNLSLVDDPRTLLRRIHNRYVEMNGSDPADIVFVLQPGVAQTDASEVAATPTTITNPRGRKNSRQFPRGIDSMGAQHTSATTKDKQAASTCLVIGDNGTLCGLQIDGLVVVERVDFHGGGGASDVYIHEYPCVDWFVNSDERRWATQALQDY
jgi:hypothetical protein